MMTTTTASFAGSKWRRAGYCCFICVSTNTVMPSQLPARKTAVPRAFLFSSRPDNATNSDEDGTPAATHLLVSRVCWNHCLCSIFYGASCEFATQRGANCRKPVGVREIERPEILEIGHGIP